MTNTWMLATQNPGKVREFQQLLSRVGIQIAPAPRDLDVAETGETFAANALLKAQAYGDAFGSAALADDSGIMIEALDGAPGIYSARWAPEGDYERLFEQLADQLQDVKKPKAAFVCVLCLYTPGQAPRFYEGRLEGHLTFPPRGEYGFGYDPIFVPEGYKQTCAQLGEDVKNGISHRRRALDLLLKDVG
jgi:XTP/dITP diphosphohydrolase